MPRYYFDIHDSVDERDDNGQELAGPVEARIHAVAYAGALLKDEPDLVWDGHEFSVAVSDAERKPVCAVYVRAEEA